MKTPFLHKTITFFFAFLAVSSIAQPPEFTVIQSGLPSGDSSYYDVCRVAEDEYWAIGKKGIITKFGTGGISEMYSHPNRGADLLNMAMLDEDNYLLCGDKGFVYHFEKSSQSWNVMQVKGYENSCFYSVCAIDKNTAFISGGRSGIVNSQRVIPFGFILKTEDGGKTWERVFRSAAYMIWSVKYDKETKRVYALIYTPVKTRLICSDDSGRSWKLNQRKIKGLFHDFNITGGNLFLAGGKNGNFRKNGALRLGNNCVKYKNTGIFWDVETSRNLALASGTNGNLLFKDHSDNWTLVHSPVDNNLYEICFIDEKSAFLVGNNKTILKVDFK